MLSSVVIVETIRRHITHVAFLIYLALLVIFAVGIANVDAPPMWPTFVGLLAIITGCGVIGPEFSSGTLQLILVKPVNRATYLLSRVTGVVCVVWIASIVAFIAEAVGHLIGGDVPLEMMAITLLNTAASIVLTVALLTLVGSLTRAYLNVAIYVVLLMTLNIVPTLLQFAKAPASIARAFNVIEQNLYPTEPPRFDGPWLLLVLSNAAVALVIACFAFRNREVPYGAD